MTGQYRRWKQEIQGVLFPVTKLFTLATMNRPSPPFSSQGALRAAFVSGLHRLIGNKNLGELVLVMANACFDPEIHAELEDPLFRWFEALAARVQGELQGGRPPNEPPDDLLVFLKLMAIGFDGVRLTSIRNEGPWEIQFNHVRAFRPRRMSGDRVHGIRAPFNPDGFHFNKPFLRQETFWSGELGGRQVDLLYNKFPFVSLHGLLVPDRTTNKPQFLERADHDHIWALTEDLGEALPGVGFGYNSYGACASVNHLHFQMFVRDAPLPVARPEWSHNGGDTEYPTLCTRFDGRDEAWQALCELHADGASYNLIYLPGALYCLPRRKQGECRHADWTSGFAWYELAGGFTTFNQQDFDTLDAGAIAAELRRVSPEVEAGMQDA